MGRVETGEEKQLFGSDQSGLGTTLGIRVAGGMCWLGKVARLEQVSEGERTLESACTVSIRVPYPPGSWKATGLCG